MDAIYGDNAADSSILFPYIVDGDSPFLDDILRITAVYDGNGDERALNDENDATSLFTPSTDILQIPYPKEGFFSYMTYRANLPLVVIPDGVELNTISVELPDSLLEPLCSWTGARALSFSNNAEQKATSLFYFNKYEHRCQELEKRNILHTSGNNSNIKPELRKFP